MVAVTFFGNGLRDAVDPEAMKTALSEWIFQPAEPDTTATLPAWEETEGQPKRAEFPFMPEKWFQAPQPDQSGQLSGVS